MFAEIPRMVVAGGLAGGMSVLGYTLYKWQQKPASISALAGAEPALQHLWNSNWDCRDPAIRVKSISLTHGKKFEENVTDELKRLTPTATRHILLIRHGQYNEAGQEDAAHDLTELGREQADWTGQRLKELNLPYTAVTSSTMTRARETTEVIHKHISHLPLSHTDLLFEGAPVPTEPPSGNWRPLAQFYMDGIRIEAAFREFVHRADPGQKNDSCEILICHGNIIRYFVCRALQMPEERWQTMALPHGSITWICVWPSGRVSLQCLGSSGHMPPDKVSIDSATKKVLAPPKD